MIKKVDGLTNPPMYELQDLMNAPKKGRYYAENLVLAPTPNENFFWEVEEILKTKTIKGVKYHLCKYLYYGSKVQLNKYKSHCYFFILMPDEV